MTVTPDPTQEPDHEPDQGPGRRPDPPPESPVGDRPTDVITSAISVTAAPVPAPAEADGHGDGGAEVEVETIDAAADHTVAFPSPIPEYAMEPDLRTDDPPTVVVPGGVPDAGATDPAPTVSGAPGVPTASYQADTEAMDSLTPEPMPNLSPETPYFPPDPPYVAPDPPYLAPGPPPPLVPESPPYLAPEPLHPAASVRPRSRPLFGTIVWGVILLALAGYVLLGVLVPSPADPTLWLLGGVILIGLLLIVVGIIAALRRAD